MATATLALMSTPESTSTQDSDRVTLLEETVMALGVALAKGEWAVVRAYYPDEFKAKCSVEEFGALMTIVWATVGYPDDASFGFEKVKIDGNLGWAVGTYLGKPDVRVEFDDDEGTENEAPEFIWEDGKWVYFVSLEKLAQDNPCSLDFGNEPTLPHIPEPPPTPLGLTLYNPLSAGEVLQGSDGTEIRVLGIVGDARQQVAEESELNDPPKEGNRFYLISLKVSFPSGKDSITVRYIDFSLIGDGRVVYDPFDHSCGSLPTIPDELRGEIFPGGELQGNVCFEIPKDESGLILIHEPFFGAGERRFLSLEK